MKKRVIAAAASAVLFAASFMAGCSWNSYGEIIVNDPKTEKEEYTELSFFGYKSGNDNLSAIEDTLRAFMKENDGINVVYEGAEETAYWAALHRRHEHEVFDDIFMVDHDSMVELIADGWLENLADCIDLGNFNAMARDQIIGGDPTTVYFVPMNISTHNLYINYDVLARHGKSVPASYAEFEDVCEYFAGQNITPVIVNNTTSLRALMTAKSMFEVYRSDETAKIDEFNADPSKLAAQYAAGIDMVADMLSKKWIDCNEGLEATKAEDDLELFGKNERPFMITSSWATMRVKRAYPELNYGVHPFLIPECGSVLVSDVRTCVGVNARSANKEAAKKFISFMTHPGALYEYCESQSGYLPTNSDKGNPVDETLAPSEDYYSEGNNVIGSDYRLNIPDLDAVLTECGKMLASGESADTVKEYLATTLRTKAVFYED